jgi:putative flippase GtrA
MKLRIDTSKIVSSQNKKRLRYIFVGVWNTIFSYAAFLGLYFYLHSLLHYTVILVLSQIVGLTNAYICYKLLVFKTKGNILREYLRFYVVYGSTFIINLLLLGLFVEILLISPVLAQGIIAIVVVIIGYVGHNRFSFKTR